MQVSLRPPVSWKEGDAHEHNGSSYFIVSSIYGIDLVYCLIHFQYNDAEWIFILQGGGMRRCGGIVDWRQRSRWKFRQVIMRNVSDTVH